ncbi:MAG TPA: anthranilate synthase component I family protein [Polyangiaceae bacterium]|nr:anthranilate synthase component I family protein [Polyangiaceae bacterium]
MAARIHQKTLVVDGLTPVSVYAALRTKARGGSFLLESVVPGERWGRYSVLGYQPESHIALFAEPGVDPFSRLAELVPAGAVDTDDVAERFATAHVGLLAYDLVHFATKVDPWPAPAHAREPLARLVGNSTVIVFDNLTHTATIASISADAVARAESHLASIDPLSPIVPPDAAALPPDVAVNVSDDDYGHAVERCKEYIRAGDAFQVVPARTFSTEVGAADVLDVYRALRVLSPAPYMYLLEFPEADACPALAVAGASPETLARVEHGRVTLRPIAGTRRRGRTSEEDDALAREMIEDPKEVAEHVMLIDLARNDIGRIARPGTVQLPMQMGIERFSHVMHIVSEVRGDVDPRYTPWDVLRATFPAGTLTGAPKVRAMQIIRELEQRPRGVYGGAIGYITRGQAFDFAIAIRTVVMREGRFEVSAGAGVVADSRPELEAKETRNKARAALAAIQAARINAAGR